MTFLSFFYTLIISPLELLFEVIFMIANKIIGSEGLSIIFLSLAVNFFVLPLYKRADELQAEERDIQAKMAPHVKHIKKKFKGDERFFMLQEYYKINHYKPIYALKSSVSLLLQIPFFIAAYNLLSKMQNLQGMHFGFISDLGKEDAYFMIGSFPINILPIAMTIINIVSGIIYTKGHPLKAKIQVYGLAAVFLVLLYHSPAGLVFYWLLNNVFSLVKNIFYKFKEPKKILKILLALSGIVFFVMISLRTDLDLRQLSLLDLGCILLTVPFLTSIIPSRFKFKLNTNAYSTSVFFTGAVFMAIFTGLLIPSTVIRSSAEEFINNNNPVIYIVNSSLLALGCWVLWGGIFFFFVSDKTKSFFTSAIWIICVTSVINYMLFGTNLGTVSTALKYNIKPTFLISEYLVNTLVIVIVSYILCVSFSRIRKIARILLFVGILTLIGFTAYNTAYIWNSFNTYKGTIKRTNITEQTPVIPLSTNGNNVVIIMLDRSLGPYVPYIFNEKPELYEAFDGFTYYPNTISYGVYTNLGAPALYGGYEYTPDKLNERSTESLQSKNDEALKVMPVLFGDNGYNVTICDPPYAGYQWIPDLSIYKDYNFNCFNTMGYYNYFPDLSNNNISYDISSSIDINLNRNFFCFSLMKISPIILQETLYTSGRYKSALIFKEKDDGSFGTSISCITDGVSRSIGYSYDFLKSYTVLTHLQNITKIENNTQDTFLMLTNNTTHEPCILQEPNYVPMFNVDNTVYDVDIETRYSFNGQIMQMQEKDQVAEYQVNMAAFLRLGEWFDYLRDQGVYDNTRIIIVSDHGRQTGQFPVLCNDYYDMQNYMALLLVKDFNATGFTVCEDFMTNADTPTLATYGLIENPVNPFTGNYINSEAKDGPQTVFFSNKWDVEINNGNTFLPGQWFCLDGNPHEPENWEYLGEW